MRWLRRSSDGDAVSEPEATEPRLRDAWAGDPPDEPREPTGVTDAGRTAASLDPDELHRSLRRAVSRALAEDLGLGGDLTSRACVPAGTDGHTEVVARDPGVLAGRDAIVQTYAQVDGRVGVDLLLEDGTELRGGDVVARVRGPLRAILTGEPTTSSLVGHLSGVATATRRYVDAVDGTGCEIRDTRATTPGLRLLEKAAVHAGGGTTRQFGLFDAVRVTTNHVLAAGGVAAATRAALERAGDAPVQVQVTSLAELETAIEAGARDLLVEAVSPVEARQAVAFARGRARIEVSGGVTLDNVRSYAESGVGAVSVGALTHPSRHLDVALDVKVELPPGVYPSPEKVGLPPGGYLSPEPVAGRHDGRE